MAKTFQIEMKKLMSKNAICLEIWGRIKKYEYTNHHNLFKLTYKKLNKVNFNNDEFIGGEYEQKFLSI